MGREFQVRHGRTEGTHATLMVPSLCGHEQWDLLAVKFHLGPAPRQGSPTPSSPSANWGRNLPTMRGWRPLWAKSSWPQGLGQGSERPPPPYAAAGNANTQAPSWFHHAEPRGPGSASCSPVPQECPIPQPFPADLNPYHLVSCNAKFRLRKTSRRCQE